jgi:hypothetical protein
MCTLSPFALFLFYHSTPFFLYLCFYLFFFYTYYYAFYFSMSFILYVFYFFMPYDFYMPNKYSRFYIFILYFWWRVAAYRLVGMPFSWKGHEKGTAFFQKKKKKRRLIMVVLIPKRYFSNRKRKENPFKEKIEFNITPTILWKFFFLWFFLNRMNRPEMGD